jgi:hypothetical protein
VLTGGVTTYEVCEVAASCKQGAATAAEAGGFASANSPSEIVVDGEESVFAMDTGNHRVQKFSAGPPPAPVEAGFAAGPINATFGAGALQNLALDTSTTPNHVLIAASREAAGGQVAVLEVDATGSLVGVHGEDLEVKLSNGLAAAPATLGANLYLSTSDATVESGGNKVFVLNEAPAMDPVTTFGGTTATFTGSVVSNEIFTLYHFEYSIDGNEWTTAPPADAEAGTASGSIPVSAEASRLTGSQLYTVRLVSNRPSGGGLQYSLPVTFTTDPAAPAIKGGGASNIADRSATLNARLDAQNDGTSYHFEYGLVDCSSGPCTALPTQERSEGGLTPVFANVTGLQPETVYHFRLVATNSNGTTTGPDGVFETRALGSVLPAGRAYELVTPSNANGLFLGSLGGDTNSFDWPRISPDGQSVIYNSEGGLPGAEGNGYREAYEAVRKSNGWESHLVAPSGQEATLPQRGGTSIDHAFAFWFTGTQGGSLETTPGEGANVLRRPDGTFELIGQGSEGSEPRAEGRWISEGGDHIVFTTRAGEAVKLEPDAPVAGTAAVYDRTPDGTTHVVSLLPTGLPPGSGEDATFWGASEEGTAVVFEVAGTLYVRVNNSETLEVASGFPIFAGVAEGGSRVFYLSAGNLFAYNTATETSIPIGSGGESTPVNISNDGSHVYFSSPQELAPGAEPLERNLYVWDGTDVTFIATLSQSDFERFGGTSLVSLANWTAAVAPNKSAFAGRAMDPSRTTPDGSVIVFQSHGISGFPYDSEGLSEIYRYDAESEALGCVSCSPTGAPAESEAELQPTPATVINAPATAEARIYNVTDDGSTVFFNTADPLIADDTNGISDVYEWRDNRLSLISSGRGASPSYLYAMTSDGHDVLFRTNETLVPQDRDGGSTSIYDARVGGGFGPVAEAITGCGAETCQPTPALPPVLPASGTSSFHGPGNLSPARKHHKRKRCKTRKKHCKKRNARLRKGGSK